MLTSSSKYFRLNLSKLKIHLNDRVYLSIVMILSQFFYLWITPIKVAFDGYLHIRSAHALFSEKMASEYHWIREPLYPFIVYLSSEASSLIYLLLLQSVFLAIGTFYFLLTIQELTGSKNLFLACISGIFAGYLLHGYAATVLQTSLFVCILGYASFLLVTIHKNSETPTWKTLVKLAILVFIASATAFYLGISLAIALLVTFWMQSDKSLKVRLLATMAIIGACATFLVPWSIYKNQTKISDSISGLGSSVNPIGLLTQFLSHDPTIIVSNSLKTFAAINNVSPEFYPAVEPGSSMVGMENLIFGLPVYKKENNCGFFFQPPVMFNLESKDFTDYRCVGSSRLHLQNAASKALSFLLTLSGYSVLFLIALGFWKKNWLPISLLILAVELPYVINTGGISRYGAPFLILGLVAFFHSGYLFRSLGKKLQS